MNMLKTHGISTETVKNLLLNAAVIYKNLKYAKEKSGWEGTVLGATSGGVKFHYEIKWLDVDVDGATVAVKGVSKQKIGETAWVEGNMTEINESIFTDVLHMAKTTSEDTKYQKYISKENIGESDYLENIGLVGTLSDGRQVIIIVPNAICTEALELDTKNAAQTTYAVKFEATADPKNEKLNRLDVAIYYPTAEA